MKNKLSDDEVNTLNVRDGLKNESTDESMFHVLLESLSGLNQDDLVQLKDDLSEIAQRNEIDLTNVDMDTLRKLIAIYTQNIMEDSAAQ